MYCPICATQHADDADTCTHCGALLSGLRVAVQAPHVRHDALPDDQHPEWEYRHLTLPLRLAWDSRSASSLWDVIARYNRIVQEQVERVRRDGWQVDGPVDWDSVRAAGRLVEYDDGEAAESGVAPVYTFEAVHIPLKRLVASVVETVRALVEVSAVVRPSSR